MCMSRLQELQFTVTGGNKVISGVSLSPRSTRGYLRTSLRCKQESVRYNFCFQILLGFVWSLSSFFITQMGYSLFSTFEGSKMVEAGNLQWGSFRQMKEEEVSFFWTHWIELNWILCLYFLKFLAASSFGSVAKLYEKNHPRVRLVLNLKD